MTEITTSDIVPVLTRNMLAGNRKPPLLLAVYGIGKSMQGRAFAKAQSMHYIDYRAAYKTFNDVRGYGVPNRESGKMEFLMDEDWDFAPDKPNCLHFEELLNAMPSVQKVLMQATLDRRIGKFIFPEDTFIFASSNRLTDKTGVERMLAALADRFAIYHIRPDLASFQSYLETHGKSAEVLAFINANSDAPYNFDIKKWDNESNLPTFRSFERLDEYVSSYTDAAEASADPLLVAHATACVGPKYGPMFAQFIKLVSKIGDINKMLDEADTCKIPSEPDLKWLVACRLIAIANKANLEKVFTLAHRLTSPGINPNWKAEKDPSSLQTFVGNGLRRRRKDLLRTPEMLDWQQRYAHVITG